MVGPQRPSAEPRRIDVGGVNVAYRRDGDGIPILYLHGSGLTRRWLPLYGLLAERHDVLVPEHPGFGDTLRPAWYRDLRDMVLHYDALLDAFALEDVHVVGHSFGAHLAAELASLFPRRARSLTLIAPPPLPYPGYEPQSVVPVPTTDAELATAHESDALLFNGNADAYPEYLAADDMGGALAPLERSDADLPGTWDDEPSLTLYRRLDRVRVPAQVLVPDEDRIIDPGSFPAWADHLPEAGTHLVSGGEHPTGHLLIVQEPLRIADLVADLVAAGERRRRGVSGGDAS
jgi:pimeloyl-ACP methyl ester carboxylesterase